MRLRPATLDDAEAIRQIYNVEVLTSVPTFDLVPRTLEDQRAWQSARSGAHTVMVADDEGEVVGFGALSRFRDRPAYAPPVEDSDSVLRDPPGRRAGKPIVHELAPHPPNP